MQIKIHSKHMELSPKQKAAVEEKVGHLVHLADRIKDESSEIRVDFSHEASRATEDAFECHLTLFIPHDTLRAESRAASLENAVDEAMDKMRPQIEKYKAKEHHMNDRRGS